MSRGIVLWPDRATATTIREIWDELADHGLPSLAILTHRLHQPHVSLTVAEHLPARDALNAVGPVPVQPIPLQIEAVGVFPQGTLYLACVVHRALLEEQLRIHEAVDSLTVEPWPYFKPGAWSPHITLGFSYASEQVAHALPIVFGRLPIKGTFDRGGVEDGTTGENWPAPSGTPPTGP